VDRERGHLADGIGAEMPLVAEGRGNEGPPDEDEGGDGQCEHDREPQDLIGESPQPHAQPTFRIG